MRTAVMGLLALTATVAAISVVTAPSAHAQVADTGAANEQPTAGEAAPQEIAPAKTSPGPVEQAAPEVATPDTPEAVTPDTPEEPAPEAAAPGEAAPAEAAPDGEVDLGTFLTTGYSLRGPMRSGAWTHYGAVAVDPRVIPLGSTIYIENLGYFVAEDTGGGVKGAWIDIWLSSRSEALNYGVQYRRAWLVA